MANPRDRFYVQPNKSIADMTDEELREFASGLARGMKRWGRRIAEREAAAGEPAPEPGPAGTPVTPGEDGAAG